MRRLAQLCLLLCLAAGAPSAHAFALLGPFAPFMTAPLAYRVPDAIGGPMKLGEGYRWNVPVITYGFDESFLYYFGTNGVAAVESAIQMFKDLPPASQIILTNYPFKSSRVNFAAQAEDLVDLKSQALVMLLEQMGLAQPTPATWSLVNFSFSSTNYSVENRNYDPSTLEATPVVNNTLVGYTLVSNDGRTGNSYLAGYAYTLPYATLPQNLTTAVAENESGSFMYGSGLDLGNFFTGLTFDDIGGLAYLYNPTNLTLENLIPGVRGSGANATNYVTAALRPGLDKFTFQRINFISSNIFIFPTVTNQYTDTYITNGVPVQQTLERVITQPDIVFAASYIGLKNVSRTGTTTWTNNGLPGHDGPGVIQPPVVINFNRAGPSLFYGDPNYSTNAAQYQLLPMWGTFDGTTNPPVTYPIAPPPTDPTELHYLLIGNNYPFTPPANFTTYLFGQPNALFALQTSADLTNWLTIGAITNLSGTFTYEDYVFPNTPQRYFRTVPQ